MEHNVLVTSSWGPGSASQAMEFELTRQSHMKDASLPYTVTACFKEPTPSLIPESMRILSEVVKGKELFPVHFGSYTADVLQRFAEGKLKCQRAKGPVSTGNPNDDPGEPSTPGSASVPAVPAPAALALTAARPASADEVRAQGIHILEVGGG